MFKFPPLEFETLSEECCKGHEICLNFLHWSLKPGVDVKWTAVGTV